MPSGYHPLTHFERDQIHAGWHRGLSKREIARQLERDPTMMARETSRNCGQRGDRHQQAQGKATSRRRAASAVPWKMTPERWAVAEEWLRAGWSPEPICGPVSATRRREWPVESGLISPSGRTDRRVATFTGACGGAESSRTGVVADMQDAVTFPVGWTSPNAR